MSDIKGKPNKLIDEKSPYLLQHAYNPVNWYPWGEEAFAKAGRCQVSCRIKGLFYGTLF